MVADRRLACCWSRCRGDRRLFRAAASRWAPVVRRGAMLVGLRRRRSGSSPAHPSRATGGSLEHGRHPRRQGPHLHQPLRPPGLGPGGGEEARRWNATADMLSPAPRLDHRPDQELRPARPRRRGLRHRPEVVLHAQGGERPAALSGGQRRRVRARHLQGPGDHAPRSAPADRGLPDRLLRDAGARLLHLHPRRIRARARGPGGGDQAGLRGQADRQEQRPRLGLRHLRPPRRRGLHLRRGDRAAGEPGGQEGPAAPEAAVPGRRRPLRLPDHGEQRRVHRGRRHHPAPRRRLVRRLRPPEQHRHQAVVRLRPREPAVQRRRGDVDPAAASCSRSTAAASAAAGAT